MARKFIQMGMTRARRYANHKGGKKYDRSARVVERDGGERVELPKSKGHLDMGEKEEASLVFKAVWEECRSDKAYVKLKEGFQAEQKEWDKAQRQIKREDVDVKEDDGVKTEVSVKGESDFG